MFMVRKGCCKVVVLSVIVPVYNMAKDGNLEYCMNSLVNQTLEGMEIIAVDDASTDNSLEILRNFEKKYPERVRVIASPENKRQGGARNLGLKEANGQYIGFMDADDWAALDLFEKMVKLAESTGADAVGTDMCRVYEHTMVPTEREVCNEMSQTGILDYNKRKDYLLTPGPVVTKIYKREIFFDKDFSFPEHMSYEDNAVVLELAMRINHYEHLPEAGYFYYQHDDSTTHFISLKKCQDRMEAMRIMLRYARENGSLEEYREVIEYKFSILFYVTTLFSYMQGSNKIDARYIKKLGKEMLETFPDFRNNTYYNEKINDYEQKLINLQLKSTFAFIIVYKLKQISKKIKSKKSNK